MSLLSTLQEAPCWFLIGCIVGHCCQQCTRLLILLSLPSQCLSVSSMPVVCRVFYLHLLVIVEIGCVVCSLAICTFPLKAVYSDPSATF